MLCAFIGSVVLCYEAFGNSSALLQTTRYSFLHQTGEPYYKESQFFWNEETGHPLMLDSMPHQQACRRGPNGVDELHHALAFRSDHFHGRRVFDVWDSATPRVVLRRRRDLDLSARCQPDMDEAFQVRAHGVAVAFVNLRRKTADAPGRGAESQLICHVTDQIEDMEMPPLAKRKRYPALSQGQVKTLTTWIDEGAEWREGVSLENQ